MSSRVAAFLLLAALPVLAKGPTTVVCRAETVGLARESIRVTVEAGVARVEVNWLLANGTQRDEEAEVLYPFPPGAVVTSYRLSMGEHELRGQLLPEPEAKKIYTDIVRQMRDPSLLRHVGGPVYRSSTFPVPAQGERALRFHYSIPVSRDGELFRLSLPLGGAGQTVLAADLFSSVPIRTIYSPSHSIAVHRETENHASLSFEAKGDGGSSFTLYYSISPEDLGLSLLAHRHAGDDGWFLLSGVPSLKLGERAAARNVLFVLDTSGSMAQEGKIEQARRALTFCLRGLARTDRFNILTFDSGVRTLSRKPQEADPDAVKLAEEFVASISARGGTAIHAALTEALSQVGQDGLSTDVVFLTDGLPTIGETDLARIRESVKKANGGKSRVFVFGVGNDVNVPFLDALALENGGSPEFVRQGDDLSVAVTSFFSRMTHPVLTDCELAFEGVEVFDVYPRDLHSLFKGQQILVFGRYKGDGKVRVRLTGKVSGERKEYTYDTTFPSRRAENTFIAPLWAARKVGYLIDEVRGKGNVPEVIDEIVRLSREYGILTEYTAFLAREAPGMTAEDLRRGVGARFDGARALETGDPAIRQANEKECRKKACTEADWRRADGVAEAQDAAGAVAVVCDRAFYNRAGCWVDARVRQERQPDIVVERFSPEYFELIEGSDDLARLLSVGERVIVEHEGKLIEVK